MKRLLIFLLLIPAFSYSQLKISDMITYAGDPAGALVPVVLNNTNRKIPADYFGYNKLDSVSINQGTAYDTLYAWRFGVKAFYKLIRAGSGGGSGAWGGITGSLSAQSDLALALAGKAASTHLHAATDITSGIVPAARLGTGPADAGKVLRGDNTWGSDSANMPIGPGLKIKNNILDVSYGYALYVVNSSSTYTVSDSVLSIYVWASDTIFLPTPSVNRNRILNIHNSGPSAVPIFTQGKPIDANGGVFYYVGTSSLTSLAAHRNIRVQSNGTSYYMIGNNTNP